MADERLHTRNDEAPLDFVTKQGDPVELELIALHELAVHPEMIGIRMAFMGASVLSEVLESAKFEEELIHTSG